MEFFIQTDAYQRSQLYDLNSSEKNWIDSEKYLLQFINGVKWYHNLLDDKIGIFKIDFNRRRGILELNDGKRRHFIISITGNILNFTNNIHTENTSFELPLKKGLNRSIKEKQIGYQPNIYRYIYLY